MLYRTGCGIEVWYPLLAYGRRCIIRILIASNSRQLKMRLVITDSLWHQSVCTYHRYQDGQTFSILYSNGKYVEGRGGRVCRRIEL